MTPATYLSYLATFKELGWKPRRVTQTVGNATASAGFHKADGSIKIKGQWEKYCAAIDVSVLTDSDGNYKPLTRKEIRELLATLAKHGFVAWYRDWDGNEHIHAIFVALKMKRALQKQVQSFLRDRDGLAGDSPETFYTAPKDLDNVLRAAFLSANDV
jgi:hypothetical protein